MEAVNDTLKTCNIEVRLAKTKEEILQAQKLRYEMLILDYNSEATNDEKLDKSDYDDVCEHLIAIDTNTNKVIGTYRLRLLSKCNSPFISEVEFDIQNLKNTKCEIVELSRAVVHKDYRNGVVIKMLWKGLFNYCKSNNVRYLIGTASFHGVDPEKYNDAFKMLYEEYLIDSKLDCPAINHTAKLNNIETYDARTAKHEIPPLIREYLLIGAKVANGAYVDEPFGSIDVLIIVDFDNLNERYVSRILR